MSQSSALLAGPICSMCDLSGAVGERLLARPGVRGTPRVADEVNNAKVDARRRRKDIRVGGQLRRSQRSRCSR